MFPKFILVKVRGRLGNQLFQIAFAKAMGRRLNCFVIYDTGHQFVWDTYFLSPCCFVNVNKFLTGLVKKVFARKYYSPLIISNDNLVEDINEISILNTVFQGYFQAPHYFSNLVKEDRIFKIRDKFLKEFRLKYSFLLTEKGVVIVHIRRTDYMHVRKVQLGNSEITLPIEYYDRCITSIDANQRRRVIALSDDIEWVKSNFKLATEFIHNSEFIFDFLLLMHAETVIISNSTFAWWAAYLNKFATHIFAPKYFLGYNAKVEYPAGIMNGTQFQWVHHQS